MDHPELRVLYLSHKRGEERELLRRAPGVRFEEVSLVLRRDLGRRFLASLGRIRSLLADFRPAVVLVETPGLWLLPVVHLVRRRGVPLAVRYKGDLWAEFAEFRAPLAPGVRLAKLGNFAGGRASLRAADLVLPLTGTLARTLARRLRPGTRVEVVPLAAAAPDPAPPPAPAGLPRPFVLSVTNFHFWAKVAPMLEAIPAVEAVLEKLDLDWIVLGDGAFFERAAALVARFRGRVRLAGRQDARGYYAARPRALLHLSGLDALPNVLLEAWTRDLPVVMNRDCPAAELTLEAGSALLVDRQDPRGFDAFARLVAAEDERLALGRRGGAWARERFAADRVAGELAVALRSVGR
jgi:glycosyltransferase involved in cell wall biosynthesis